MANTFTLISSSTVGSGGASSITFSSIPSTYTDLCLKISARATGSFSQGFMILRINGTTPGNVVNRYLTGDGSNAATSSTISNSDGSAAQSQGATSTSLTFSNGEWYIPNYAGSTIKNVSSDSAAETNGTNIKMSLIATGSPATTAISSLSIVIGDDGNGSLSNFAQYSTAYLYGIKNS